MYRSISHLNQINQVLRSNIVLFNTNNRYASSLVIAQHKNGQFDPSLLNTVAAAKALGGPVSVLVAGKGIDKVAQSVAKLDGVSTVLTYENAKLDNGIAENVSALVGKIHAQKKFSHILLAATNEGKNIMPRISAKVDGAAISEILKVNSENEFQRPMYAGNAIATVTSSHSPKVMTVRATAFEKVAAGKGNGKVEKVDFPEAEVVSNKVKFVEEKVAKSDRPEITAANVVVAGGRALKDAKNFEILYKFADTFKQGAAVGASRAAVDAGYAPNDLQIGQTGKVCAPNLYFAVGISGAIQHLAGMKDSKCIVAINTDEEAPIFQVSDYGLKEDLFKAIPELTQKLNK